MIQLATQCLPMHVSAANPPSEASVAINMRRLASLGLLVNISEMDVRVKDLGSSAQRFDLGDEPLRR